MVLIIYNYPIIFIRNACTVYKAVFKQFLYHKLVCFSDVLQLDQLFLGN